MDVEQNLEELLTHVNTLSLKDLKDLQRHVVPAVGNDTWYTGSMLNSSCFTTMEVIEHAYTVEATTFIGAERQMMGTDFVKNRGVIKGFCIPLAVCMLMRPKLYPELTIGIAGYSPGNIRSFDVFVEQIVNNTMEYWAIYQSKLWSMDEMDHVAIQLIAKS